MTAEASARGRAARTRGYRAELVGSGVGEVLIR